jgi:MFS family permease
MARLTAAVLVSSAGDPFSQAVSLVLLYQATRAPIAIAAAYGAEMLGVLTVGVLIGTVADRVDRRRLIVWLEASRFLIVASLALVTSISVFLLYPALFLLASIEALVQPARQAAVSEVVSGKEVNAANALLMTAVTMAQATGFAVAGMGLAHFSNPRLLYLVDALTFATASMLIATLNGLGGGVITTRLQGGVLRAWAVPGVRPLLVVAGGTVLFVGMLNPSLLPVAYALSGSGPTAFTLLEVCLITGAFLGSLLASRVEQSKRLKAQAISLWIFSAGVFSVGVSPSFLFAGVAVAISGVGNALYSVTNTSALMDTAASTNRGTVMSARFTVTRATMALGLAIGAAAASWLGPLRAFSSFGLGLLLVAGMYTAFMLVQARARHDSGGPHHPYLPENLDRDRTG